MWLMKILPLEMKWSLDGSILCAAGENSEISNWEKSEYRRAGFDIPHLNLRDPNLPYPINTSIFGAWEPVSSPSVEFLRIRRNGGMEKDYLLEEYGFWRKMPVFSKYFKNWYF